MAIWCASSRVPDGARLELKILMVVATSLICLCVATCVACIQLHPCAQCATVCAHTRTPPAFGAGMLRGFCPGMFLARPTHPTENSKPSAALKLSV